MYNLHTLLYMKKEKCLRFDILMEIFCLACTYIVQTYNYSRVKKVHEHIPHMQSSWGYCLWINRQIYTGMLKIGTFFLD